MRFRYWLLIAAGLFIIGLGAGFIISAVMPESVVSFFTNEISSIEGLSDAFGPFQASTVVFIFFKNVSVLLFSFIFSPVLCLMPALALVFNGALLSFLGAVITQQESLGFLLAGILPHGILEIPALIIGEAAALSLGAAAIKNLFFKKEGDRFLPALRQNLKYMALALALLVPAAVIETFVTPMLIQ